MDRSVVAITGGGGDLAAAIAHEFTQQGATVYRPGRDELDVRDRASISAWFSQHERLDVLINNAGITGDALFAKLSPEAWDEVIDTNLRGAFLCSQAAAAIMAEQGHGHLLQIGSYSALHPPIGQSAYASSKAGLIGLTKSLAKEFGPKQICVNCVLPGFLETRMTASLPDTVRAQALARHALGRFNTPEEAARFIYFLSQSPTISGQVFQLDSRV